MNWHDTLLVQTITKETSGKVVLKMKYPSNNGGYDLVLEVVFIKKAKE